jgi:hypothetical protein
MSGARGDDGRDERSSKKKLGRRWEQEQEGSVFTVKHLAKWRGNQGRGKGDKLEDVGDEDDSKYCYRKGSLQGPRERITVVFVLCGYAPKKHVTNTCESTRLIYVVI